MREFRIYKPRKTNDGAATKFNVSVKKYDKYSETMLFLEMARQTGVDENGNAAFAWKEPAQKVVLKLEELDVGSMLATLNGHTDECKLFHQNEHGTSTLNLKFANKEGNSGYYLNVSKKGKTDTEAVRLQHTISMAESMVLKTLLNQFLVRKYGW